MWNGLVRAGGGLLALLLVVGVVEARGKKEPAPPTLQATQWLTLGPVGHAHAVFDEAPKVADLLDATHLPDPFLEPSAGLKAIGPLAWSEVSGVKDGRVSFERPAAEDLSQVGWAATYVTTPAFAKVEIELTGAHPRRLWLDGKPLVSGGGDSADDEIKKEVELDPGTHTILVKTVFDPERKKDWTVGVTLHGDQPSLAGAGFSANPQRAVEFRDVTDAPTISSLALSPDGTRYVRNVSRIRPGTHDRESWIEIRALSPDRTVMSWRGMSGASQVSWSPDGSRIAYLASTPGKDAGKTLFVYELDSGSVRALLEGVKELQSYRWSPTGTGIVFTTQVKAEKDKRGVKLLEGLMDRQATYRNKSYLHWVDVTSGVQRRLTAGDETTSLQDISADGKRLLFSRLFEDLEEIPFSRNELWELELSSGKATKLREIGWLNGVSYAPVGDKLLIGARADEFEGRGVNVEEGQIANSYDGQLFIWDRGTDEVDPITLIFDPAVQNAVWSRHDGRIYLTGTDRDLVELYRYDPADGSYSEFDTGVEAMESFTLAESASVALVRGTSVWTPQQLRRLDLEDGTLTPLHHPNETWFHALNPGTVKPFRFETTGGKAIDGRVYYPPNFDAAKKYPTIVYYYGGTVPVSRAFGGRYPKEWWASQGYLVFVPQPSGATGYGQSFSAEHVNNWGITTADQIIEGTQKFLAAHPSADPKRVGCIGASYGGFMTMLLTTKTDLFAAAVAHAGISSISSYWGEGNWGYSYSGAATAGSYPWNRSDIYVDQSPLFRADKHQVPLLLTHGRSDTNVPVGESDQFFIALRLLGKQVEYLQVEGEDHWILDHAKRTVWSRSIVAWFDRWLKEDDRWWNALYSERD